MLQLLATGGSWREEEDLEGGRRPEDGVAFSSSVDVGGPSKLQEVQDFAFSIRFIT